MESGLYVVATPIGNRDDVTARAVEVLRDADVVYAEDTRRTGRLLAAFGLDSPVRSLHAHNEAARTDEVLKRLGRGERCVLVSDAGTPAISDPGRRLVANARSAGHRIVPIPGPSAVIAALSVAGLTADRFAFEGFPPRSGAEREAWLARVAGASVTTVVFESARRVEALLADLEAAGLGDRTVVLCRELTKLHEEVRAARLPELRAYVATQDLRGEVTLVIEAGSGATAEPSEVEVRVAARRLAGEGLTTRDIARRLQEELGVSRNAAYEAGLRACGEGEE